VRTQASLENPGIRRHFVSFLFAVALLVAIAPAGARAAPTPIAIDNAAPSLTDKDATDWTLDLGVTNFTDRDVTLSAAPAAAGDSDCTFAFDKNVVPAAQHLSPEVTVSKKCDLSDGRLVFNLDATSTGSPPITLGLTASTPTDSSPNWIFLAFFPGFMALFAILFVGFYWIRKSATETARPAPSPADGAAAANGNQDAAGEPEPPKKLSPFALLVNLPDDWSFSESWATNITVGAALLTGIFGNTETVKAFLGDDAESSIALATVGAAVAVAFAGAGGVVLLAFKQRLPVSGYTVFGMLAAASVTLAGAFGEIWILFFTVKDLDLGGVQHYVVYVTVGATALLVIYAFRSLLEVIPPGTLNPAPTTAEKVTAAKKLIEVLDSELDEGSPAKEPVEDFLEIDERLPETHARPRIMAARKAVYAAAAGPELSEPAKEQLEKFSELDSTTAVVPPPVAPRRSALL
jgi:hypothetical protein